MMIIRNVLIIAVKNLCITKLLDAEDMNVSQHDEKSIITYLAFYFHTLSEMKAGTTCGQGIRKAVL